VSTSSPRAAAHGQEGPVRGETLTARSEIQIDAPAPRLMVSALGSQLLKVTGRLADGTILWMTGPTTIAEHSVPTITQAAADAGRPAPESSPGSRSV